VTTSPTTVTFSVNSTGVILVYTVIEKTIINGTVYVNVTVTTKYLTYNVTAVTVFENITTILPTYGVFANGYGFYIMIQTPAPVKYLSYMVYAYFANYSQMVVIASPLYTSITGNYTLVVGYNLTSGVQHIILSTVRQKVLRPLWWAQPCRFPRNLWGNVLSSRRGPTETCCEGEGGGEGEALSPLGVFRKLT